MKPTPEGWPRISPTLFYDDAAAAIDWLCRAFGFVVRLRVDGAEGRIEHSELEYGDGLIMVAGAGSRYAERAGTWRAAFAAPGHVAGRVTQSVCVYVDDAGAHCESARAAGAEILEEPATIDHGDAWWADRVYAARDPEGHTWWFLQRVRTKGVDVD